MEKSFAGKVVMVTGSTSGIGHAAAIRFAEAGARVAALGRDRSALGRVKSEIEQIGAAALTIAADVTSEQEVRNALDETIESFSGLDVLVNAAGHISSGTIENTKLEAWDAMMDVNLRAVFLTMQMA